MRIASEAHLDEVTRDRVLAEINKTEIVNDFHKLYYDNAQLTWMTTKWKGIHAAKCPLDMWQYQEIIQDTQPDVIIETGTWHGGSAVFLRDMLRLCGKRRGIVITIDISPEGIFTDEDGVIQVIGDSTSDKIVESVKKYIGNSDRVMVILDSDHSQTHVLKELNTWAGHVSSGCYLVVEDTNVNGHPTYNDHGPGPMEALEEWLPNHPEFQHDAYRERLMMTFNPSGYYKRLGSVERGNT
jgi:cephalosporin hydroxylase